jgi:hypothetical protein
MAIQNFNTIYLQLMKESAAINNLIEPARGDEPEEVVSRLDSSQRETTGLDHASAYSLANLLNYHDKEFVLNVYAVIANRQPDAAELTTALDDLRSGRRTKTEVVEELVDRHPAVRIYGVRSPVIRKLRGMPIVGYWVRMLGTLARLPVLVRHQQQFESFVIGQQRSMAESMNEALATRNDIAGDSEQRETISDAIKAVMMLSDSLIELSGSFAEVENRLQHLEAQEEAEVAELRATLTKLSQALQNHQEEGTAAIQRIQQQMEISEDQVSSALTDLIGQLQAQQQHFENLQMTHRTTAAAQREFLINEQRAIVEAERAAVDDLQMQLHQTSIQTEAMIGQIKAQLCELRTAIESFQDAPSQK